MQGHGAGAVAGRGAVFPHHQPGHLYPRRLHVLGVDAVVPCQWVGENDDLPSERGVSQHLLVAGHAGAEDHLAKGFSRGAKDLAREDGAVLENEVSSVCQVMLWRWSPIRRKPRCPLQTSLLPYPLGSLLGRGRSCPWRRTRRCPPPTLGLGR